MMKRRIVAAVAAVLLAAVGAVALFAWVNGADQRAMAGMQTTQVLVVKEPIAKGTPVAQLTTKQVGSKELPQTAVVPGAVTSLDELSGLVATTDLQPGEQVIAPRFALAETLTNAQSAPVPKGLQELSLQLDSQRVLGANLVPGDTVGVFLTVGQDPNRKTHFVAHKVLVSRVQGGLAAAAPASDKTADKAAPLPDATSVMVTLAVTAAQAEKIVFAAETGNVWLSHEPADADENGTKIINDGNALQ